MVLTCNVIMPLLIDTQPIVCCETFCLAKIGSSLNNVECISDGSPLNCFNKLPILSRSSINCPCHDTAHAMIQSDNAPVIYSPGPRPQTQIRTFISRINDIWLKPFHMVHSNTMLLSLPKELTMMMFMVCRRHIAGTIPCHTSQYTCHVFALVWQLLIESHIRRDKVQLNTRNARSWYNSAVSVKCRLGIRIWYLSATALMVLLLKRL